jgi:hypothetical protein
MNLTASWQCPGQISHSKTAALAYSPPVPQGFSAITWYLSDPLNHIDVLYGRYHNPSNLFDLYDSGAETACDAYSFGGSYQYAPLQQSANITELDGVWMGLSAFQYGSPPQPNDCYRVAWLQFYYDPTVAVSRMGVQVFYLRHDTTTYDLLWASELSPVVLSAEPITATARLQMQLPADPSGNRHVLSTVGTLDATQPITLHGTNSKCNANFLTHTTSVAVQPTIGNFTSFAIRLVSSSVAGGASDEADQLASQCAVDSPLINSTIITGHTGSCFPLFNGTWGVIQFTAGDVGALHEFNDAQCQKRSTSDYSALYEPVGECSLMARFNGSNTYAMVVHAFTPSGALAAINALSPNITSIPSSSTSTAAAGEPNPVNTARGTSTPFPITNIGLVVGGCVVALLLAFLVWCWRDTRKSSASILPGKQRHESISIECTTMIHSQACTTA